MKQLNPPREVFNQTIVMGFFILLIIIVSLFLRWYSIDSKDIWLDEANSILTSEAPPAGIIAHLKLDSSPPLFYLLLHYWIELFGDTEMAVRSLSVLFGLSLVIAIFLIGSKLFTREAGIYAALIAATSPLQIMYSQEVRMYTLLPLLSVLSMYFLIRFIQEDKKVFMLLYSATALGCFYTHNYGLFLIPVYIMMLFLFQKPSRSTRTAYFLSLGGIIAAYGVWLPIFISQLRNGTHYAWIDYFWNIHGFWGSIFQSLKSFSPGGSQLGFIALNSLSFPSLPISFTVALLVFFIAKTIVERKRLFCWILLYLFVPLITAALISALFSPIYLAGRTDQLVFPAFCLFIGVSISVIKAKWLRYGIITMLITFSSITLSDYYKINLKYGDKEIADTVIKNLKKGDIVLCTSLTRASLEYYLRGYKEQIHIFSYPLGSERHLGNEDIKVMLNDPARLIHDAKSLEKKAAQEDGRLFILYVPNPVDEYLKTYFINNIAFDRIKTIGKFQQSLTHTDVQILLIDLKGR
jgi:uncharacterized membrane protein